MQEHTGNIQPQLDLEEHDHQIGTQAAKRVVVRDPIEISSMPDITINAGDIEIGAVEIKDGTTDTRAVVGVNGIEVLPNETPPTDASKVNGSLVISNTDAVQDSTKTITKTIGAVSYIKTLSLNAGGDVIAVSAWSVV